MPTVYKDRLSISGMNARSNVRASGDDFGAIEAGSMREAAQAKGQQAQANATLARGLMDVGSAAFQINERLDEANANELDARYTEFERSALHDPKNGYYAKQGKDALDGRAPLERSIKDQIDSIAKDARSDRARAAFYQLAQRRAGDTFTRADAYAQDQLRVYENTTDEAKIAEAINNAALQYNDPSAFKANIDTVIGTSTRMARRLGLSGDAERNFVQTKQSAAYGTSIIAMAANDPEKADALFREVRGGMTVGDATRVENTLRPAVMDAKARVAVDDAWNKTGGNYAESMKIIDEIKDTALHDEALRRLDQKQAHVDRAKNVAEAAASDAMYKILNNGGSLSSVPLSILANVDPQQLNALKESEANKYQAQINGNSPEMKAASRQTTLWLESLSMQDAGYEVTPGMPRKSATKVATGVRKFVEPGFLESIYKQYYVSPEDQLKMNKLRADIRAGGAGEGSLEKKTFNKALDSAQIVLGPRGIDVTPSSKDSNAYKKGMAFQSTLMESVRDFTEKEQRAPTQKELDDIVSKAILNSDRSFGMKKTGGSFMKPATKSVVEYSAIPVARRDAIRSMLQKKSPDMKIKESDIENAYADYLQSGD